MGLFVRIAESMSEYMSLKAFAPNLPRKNTEGVVRHGLKKCGQGRKQFTVRVGTVFENRHIPLTKWLQATFLMVSSKKGISAQQLERTLEITYKSAWFMAYRLREAMAGGFMPPMGGEGSVIETEETYIGNKLTKKERVRTAVRYERQEDGKIKRITRLGYGHKHTVVALVERDGSVQFSM